MNSHHLEASRQEEDEDHGGEEDRPGPHGHEPEIGRVGQLGLDMWICPESGKSVKSEQPTEPGKLGSGMIVTTMTYYVGSNHFQGTDIVKRRNLLKSKLINNLLSK